MKENLRVKKVLVARRGDNLDRWGKKNRVCSGEGGKTSQRTKEGAVSRTGQAEPWKR